jgi:hypothetical protein
MPEEIRKYLCGLLDFLDGRGLIITDQDLIDEALLEYGEFAGLKELMGVS